MNMASNWYYKQADLELGPYTFRYLVEMVRKEKPTAAILVRSHYLNEWQRAESVVGLFHVAHCDQATLFPINYWREISLDDETELELNDEVKMGDYFAFVCWMYVVDLVIFVTALTCFSTWRLEAHADEV